MCELNIAKRDLSVKAKQVRREGRVPCMMAGGKLMEGIAVTAPVEEVQRLLRKKSRGGKVTLHLGNEDYQAVIKDIGYNSNTRAVEDLTFQILCENEPVKTVAQLVLTNRDKIPTMVRVLMQEVPYQAVPEHLIETIEIDLGMLKPGDSVAIKDLKLYENPDIEPLADAERPVLTIVSSSRKKAVQAEQ